MMRMRYPDFLIVGAMKSGTTSMYFDLQSHHQVFMPQDKEPDALITDDVFSSTGRAAYAALFRKAGDDQICGEASTSYSKVPDYNGAAERALRICGDRLRIIYLVRDPIERLVSHHHHSSLYGLVGPDLRTALSESNSLLDYGRYAFQIAPWLNLFGSDRVRILKFEEYAADRRRTLDDIAKFLGIDCYPADHNFTTIHNASDDKPAPSGAAWRLAQTSLYKSVIRPAIPRSVRQPVQRLLQPDAPPKSQQPSLEDVDFILDALSNDHEQLQQLMGRCDPVWDRAEIRARYAAEPQTDIAQTSSDDRPLAKRVGRWSRD